MRTLLTAAALICGTLLTTTATAGPRRPALCVITTNDGTYRGPCRFVAERGGSFAVDRSGERPMIGGISLVNVTVIRPGHAEVSGLFGANVSRWGPAVRSRRDPACGVGEDFSVCVY